MATPSLTDQERAILAQFVASSTSDPGNAPILIQYALDRKAREPNSTMAEIVSALSPNGIDAGVDYGPYLDVVNRTLGPVASENPATAYSGQRDGSSVFDWTPFETSTPVFRQSPAAAPVDTTMDPNNPNTPDWANLDAIGAAENSPYHQWTHPNEVRAPAQAQTTPNVTAAPDRVQVADIQEPFSTFDLPAPATSVPPPRSRPASPVESQPVAVPQARNPISDVRLPPATPQFTTPPRSTAISPTGPILDNAPSAKGANVAKDQSRLTDAPTSPKLAFNETPNVTQEGLAIRPVQTISIDPRTGMPFSDSAPVQVHTPQAATGLTIPTAAPSIAATGMTYPPAVNPSAPLPAFDPTLLAALEAVAQQAAVGAPRVDPRREVARGQDMQLADRLALADEQRKSAGIPWNSDMAQDPLAAQALAMIAERNAPRSIAKTTDVATKNGPAPASNGLRLSDNDRELLARAVATEVDPRIARTNPEAYALQAHRIIDTIVNRVASPQFPDTVAGVLNQRNQFSAINGPVGGAAERYGAVENIPAERADATLRNIVSTYLDERIAGAARSSVGGAVNYANPNAVDAQNLDWVNGLDYAVDEAGPFSHRYGVAQGNRPFEATFTNPALDAANALAGGSLGTMMPSRLTNTGKEDDKRINVSSSPFTDTWTGSANTGSRDTVAQRESGKQVAKAIQQASSREVSPTSWTSPAPSTSDRVRAAQAASQTSRAAQTSSATSRSTQSASDLVRAAGSSGNGGTGISSGGISPSSRGSGSSWSGSNSGSTGSKTSTTSTSSATKSSTTSKSSYTGASDSVRGNSSTSSSKSSTSASDKVRGRG